jgi:hypothetical protein
VGETENANFRNNGVELEEEAKNGDFRSNAVELRGPQDDCGVHIQGEHFDIAQLIFRGEDCNKSDPNEKLVGPQ